MAQWTQLLNHTCVICRYSPVTFNHKPLKMPLALSQTYTAPTGMCRMHAEFSTCCRNRNATHAACTAATGAVQLTDTDVQNAMHVCVPSTEGCVTLEGSYQTAPG